jgi:class 3 adenylate cyclase
VPNARYVELPGVDHIPFVGDADSVLAEVEAFVTGDRPPFPDQRRLLAVVAMDAAGGDRAPQRRHAVWRELLGAYDQVVRTHAARFDAVSIHSVGTRFVLAFEGPGRALRCALGIIDATEHLGLPLRIGVHAGECELAGDEVVGVVPQVSADLTEAARPGEILATESARDLVAGSGIRFGEHRDIELSGAAGRRSVLPVLVRGESPDRVRRLAVEQSNVFRRDGEYWTVAFDGQVSTLRDSKGMRDLATLLVEPDREHHVADLAASDAGGGTGLSTSRGAFDPVIDRTAREQYRARLRDLDEQIDDADAEGDAARSAASVAEREALVAELSRAYGIGGQVRRSPDHIERARKAVSRRIREAIARIAQAHPTLGRHLQAAVHTGVLCRYSPEREVSWRVEIR